MVGWLRCLKVNKNKSSLGLKLPKRRPLMRINERRKRVTGGPQVSSDQDALACLLFQQHTAFKHETIVNERTGCRRISGEQGCALCMLFPDTGECIPCNNRAGSLVPGETSASQNLKMACWTADNTKTLIALIVTQLVFTGIILVCIAIMVGFVITSVKKVQQSAATIANVTSDTAKDLQRATSSVGSSATRLLGAAATSLETLVGKKPEAVTETNK
jgi:hypothetical protein